MITDYLRSIQEVGFEKLPKGWTQKSVKKAGKTIAKDVGDKSPKEKGFFDKCVKKMRGDVKDPEGYCAAIKDEAYKKSRGDKAAAYWRGKGKTEKEAKLKIAKMRKESISNLKMYDNYLVNEVVSPHQADFWASMAGASPKHRLALNLLLTLVKKLTDAKAKADTPEEKEKIQRKIDETKQKIQKKKQGM